MGKARRLWKRIIGAEKRFDGKLYYLYKVTASKTVKAETIDKLKRAGYSVRVVTPPLQIGYRAGYHIYRRKV